VENFADRLTSAILRKNSRVVVGLDPHPQLMPPHLREDASLEHGEGIQAEAHAIMRFNEEIIEAIAEHVVAVKPQVAFYERLGSWGFLALEKTLAMAREAGLLVIVDGKRNDIGSTAAAYAEAYLGDGPLAGDALTVNAYLGEDGLRPFIDRCRGSAKGLFILLRTSNPSAGDVQDLPVHGRPLFLHLADLIDAWSQGTEGEGAYRSVGVVVGATYAEEARQLRRRLPNLPFLVPGYGHQGGTAADVASCFNPDGTGAIVNSSRGVIFAYRERYGPEEFARAAKDAARDMKVDINRALGLGD
jgi:orotidine-5'-phosphate decarboxylase